jgi:hypothetical protein
MLSRGHRAWDNGEGPLPSVRLVHEVASDRVVQGGGMFQSDCQEFGNSLEECD